MSLLLSPPLTAKNGTSLRVLIIVRISTDKQDERSLDDQVALIEAWLDRHWGGQREIEVISGIGSGERKDREELAHAYAQVESGLYDLVIAEDLGRIMRRISALEFCETAEDHDTRVITLNDHLDTGSENWRMTAIFSSFHHENSNADTSRRIRRTVRNRFVNGGALRPPIFGYIHPPDAKLDSEVQRDPAAETIYEQWFSMLEDGAKFADVADWLNQSCIAPTGACKNAKWDGPMVGRITRNPLLKGVRQHNRTTTRRENKTGRRKAVKAAPEELLTREVPHLKFIKPERFDRLMVELNRRNAACRRRKKDGRDPRKQVPKKRTRFPGQTIFCGICGRMFVYGGHGREAHLMCRGAREHVCWNGITCGEVDTRNRVCDALFAELDRWYGFDDDFVARVTDQDRLLHESENAALRRHQDEIVRLEREVDNLVSFIGQGRSSDAVSEQLHRRERELTECRQELQELKQRQTSPLEFPPPEELRRLLLESIDGLACESFEFSRHLRKVIPRIVVFPYRLVDSDKLVFKAQFRLHLSKLLASRRSQEALASELDRVVEIDLYDPPQREAFRERIVELCKHMTVAQAAEACGITKTAAQYALKLQRLMDEQGLADPYVRTSGPPSGSRKLRRHEHPRYRFDPLPNADEV